MADTGKGQTFEDQGGQREGISSWLTQARDRHSKIRAETSRPCSAPSVAPNTTTPAPSCGAANPSRPQNEEEQTTELTEEPNLQELEITISPALARLLCNVVSTVALCMGENPQIRALGRFALDMVYEEFGGDQHVVRLELSKIALQLDDCANEAERAGR